MRMKSRQDRGRTKRRRKTRSRLEEVTDTDKHDEATQKETHTPQDGRQHVLAYSRSFLGSQSQTRRSDSAKVLQISYCRVEGYSKITTQAASSAIWASRRMHAVAGVRPFRLPSWLRMLRRARLRRTASLGALAHLPALLLQPPGPLLLPPQSKLKAHSTLYAPVLMHMLLSPSTGPWSRKPAEVLKKGVFFKHIFHVDLVLTYILFNTPFLKYLSQSRPSPQSRRIDVRAGSCDVETSSA
jgi:hypothetical protein